MKKEIYWCDLCGKEVEALGYVSLAPTEGGRLNEDICPKCISVINETINSLRKENNAIPKEEID